MHAADVQAFSDLQKEIEEGRKFTRVRMFVRGKIDFGEISWSTPGDASGESPFQPERGLLRKIVTTADAICVTTHITWERSYAGFSRNVAKGMILEEAPLL